MRIGIDFGATNTDVVLRDSSITHRWTLPSDGPPDERRITAALAAGKMQFDLPSEIAVTGGNQRKIPQSAVGATLVHIDEIQAIGRGGLAMTGLERALIVSAGSGTAMVAASTDTQYHVTGTGVGGGTLMGLGRLLLGTADPLEIDLLARTGDPTGGNLTLGEIIGGAIGHIPANATAINFGRLARANAALSREDCAATLVNLVGQVIAVIAINAARAQGIEPIVIVGHLVDLASVRATMVEVGEYYGARIVIPPEAGYATALGALLAVEAQTR